MTLTDSLTIYVDESGDAGTLGQGSRWLVLAGVVETRSSNTLHSALIDIARRRKLDAPFVIHFAHIRNARVQYAAYRELTRADFTAIVVAADTTSVRPGEGLARPSVLYRYALKLLVERASQLAAQLERPLDVVIEASGHFDLSEFHSYLSQASRRRGAEDRMNWDVVEISRIRQSQKQEELLLGAADGVALAFFRALEPPAGWEIPMPTHAELLVPHLWRGVDDTRVLSNGMAFLPTQETPRFLREYPEVRRMLRQ